MNRVTLIFLRHGVYLHTLVIQILNSHQVLLDITPDTS